MGPASLRCAEAPPIPTTPPQVTIVLLVSQNLLCEPHPTLRYQARLIVLYRPFDTVHTVRQVQLDGDVVFIWTKPVAKVLLKRRGLDRLNYINARVAG